MTSCISDKNSSFLSLSSPIKSVYLRKVLKKTTWKSASVQTAKHLLEGPKCSVTRSLFIYCFSVNLYITVDAFQEVSVTRTKYLFVRLG